MALTLLFTFHMHAQPIKLMTYNIRLDVASDGEDDWAHRRDFLVSQIKFYEPDILGIQEGLPHQVLFLEKKLGEYNREGIGREGIEKGESSAIFYNWMKFSAEQSHTFWLSPTPDSISMGWDAACLRVCTAVLFKDKKTKQRFWVFNTHLDHMGEIARVKGVELILAKIKTFNTQKLPVIFMGDLNATPESTVVARLKTELDDTRLRSTIDSLGPEGTFNGFKFGEPRPKRIDYIFVSREPAISVKKYAILDDSKHQRYPSDHFPVFVEISLQK
jgi:endonuclease/exonuclease/phosphatase family metal-dependent hydrolase